MNNNQKRQYSRKDRKNVNIPNYLIKIKLQNIKKQILVRKYAYIYLKKIFGNYLPSKATHHYEKRLTKTIFMIWKTYWWHAKEEWRLNLRANCYHRLIIVKKSFNVWHQYVKIRKHNLEKIVASEQHYKKVILSRCFMNIVSHRNESLCRRMTHNLINEVYQALIKKHKVLCEIQKVVEEYKILILTVICINLRRQVLLGKCLLHWRAYSTNRKIKKEKVTKALQKNQTNIKKFGIKAWKKYTSSKKTKHLVLKLSDEMYHEKCLKKAISIWKHQYINSLNENKTSSQMIYFYNTRVLKTCFQCWHSQTLQRKHNKLILQKLHGRRSLRLKARAFHSLRLYSTTKQHQRILYQNASQYRILSTMKHTWAKWSSAGEAREDEKQSLQIERALLFWRNSVFKVRFKALRRYTIMQRRKHELHNKSESIRESKLLSKCVRSWLSRWTEVRDEMTMEKQAVAIHQVIVLRRCLTTWSRQYHETTWLKKLEETASNHFKHKMMRTCILDWSKWSDLRAGERILSEQVDTQYRKKLQFRSLQQWKRFVSESCKRKDTLTRAILRHRETVTRRVFLGWLQSCRASRAASVAAEQLACRRSAKEKQTAFRRWCLHTVERKIERARTCLAMRHHRLASLRHAMVRWRRYLGYKARKRRREAEWSDRARERLHSGLLRRYLHQWQSEYRTSWQAEKHYNSKLTKMYFNVWRISHRNETANKEKKKKLSDIGTMLICKRCVDVWLARYAKEKELKNKGIKSLVHWCENLQRKCLKQWHDYTVRKQRSRSRYREAELFHRQLLQQEALTVWLQAAAVAREEQRGRALARATEVTKDQFRIASKCFQIWKTKVWGKKQSFQNTTGQNKHRHNMSTNALTAMHKQRFVSHQREAMVGAETNFTDATRKISSINESREHEALFHRFSAMKVNRPQPRIPHFLRENLTLDKCFSVSGEPHEGQRPVLEGGSGPITVSCRLSRDIKTTNGELEDEMNDRNGLSGMSPDSLDSNSCPTDRTYTVRSTALLQSLVPPQYYEETMQRSADSHIILQPPSFFK